MRCPAPAGLRLAGPAKLGFGLGHPEHEPRVLRLGPHRLVELGMRPDEPALQLVRSGVVQTSLGQSELRPRVLPASLLAEVLLVPQRPLDRQACPLSLELRLDPPLELLPLHPECPADGQADQDEDQQHASAAPAGFRRHHRQARSSGPIRRAWIGRPSTNRRTSSANAPASAYRRGGSLCRHFRQIVSRSRGTFGFNRAGGTGSSATTCRSVSEAVSPRNGGLPVSIS